jgi:hypothetical protein
MQQTEKHESRELSEKHGRRILKIPHLRVHRQKIAHQGAFDAG